MSVGHELFKLLLIAVFAKPLCISLLPPSVVVPAEIPLIFLAFRIAF